MLQWQSANHRQREALRGSMLHATCPSAVLFAAGTDEQISKPRPGVYRLS